jgi:hypothetical protein
VDLNRILQELYARREQLVQTIAALEAHTGSGLPKQDFKRRGRKFMSAEEREQVSERMKRYWASRRKLKPQGSP